ncbi:NADH-ubiquinone oxidoreductase 11kDa subunit [Gracilaria domingensis]|nr:NADH-ubiquinone oxidoreductase 11kDa subunit [Gracilaria domingensis]
MYFIKYWIKRGMEDPEDREAKTKAHLEKLQANIPTLKKRWDTPLLPKGYWNAPGMTYQTKERVAEAEAQVLSLYERALADMDAIAKKDKSSAK